MAGLLKTGGRKIFEPFENHSDPSENSGESKKTLLLPVQIAPSIPHCPKLAYVFINSTKHPNFVD